MNLRKTTGSVVIRCTGREWNAKLVKKWAEVGVEAVQTWRTNRETVDRLDILFVETAHVGKTECVQVQRTMGAMKPLVRWEHILRDDGKWFCRWIMAKFGDRKPSTSWNECYIWWKHCRVEGSREFRKRGNLCSKSARAASFSVQNEQSNFVQMSRKRVKILCFLA